MQISEYLTNDHKQCDELFSEVENNISSGNYDKIEEKFENFMNETLSHFEAEEEFVFPPIDERMGTSEGPTYVMKMEHNQMRQVMQEMMDALQNQNYDDFLGLSDTFMILLQQHNAKEEQVLYAMADNMLADIEDDVLKNIKNVKKDTN